MRILKSIFSEYTLHFLSIGINLILLPLILFEAGDKIYANWVVLLSVLSFMNLSDLGFQVLIVKSFHKYSFERYNEVFNKSLIISFSLNIFFLILLNVYLLTTEIHYTQLNLLLLALYILLVPFKLFIGQLLVVNKSFVYSILNGTVLFVFNLSSYLLLIIGLGLNSFLIAQLLSVLLPVSVGVVMNSLQSRSLKLSLPKSAILEKEILRFNLWFFLSKIAAYGRNYTDVLIIGSLLDENAVLQYSLTYKVPSMIIDLVSKPTTYLSPYVAKIIENKRFNLLKMYIDNTLKTILPISQILIFLLVLNLHWIIDLWLGEEYFAGQQFTWLLGLVLAKEIYSNFLGLPVFLSHKIRGQSIYLLSESLINIALTVFLVNRFGIEGALLSTVILSVAYIMIYLPVNLGVLAQSSLIRKFSFNIMLFCLYSFSVLFISKFFSLDKRPIYFSILISILVMLIIFFFNFNNIRSLYARYTYSRAT